jgi:hypothetical protein
MTLASTGVRAGEISRSISRRPFESSVGLKILVPGWTHFEWGQRARGRVLSSSFAVAVIAGLWTWGTWLGWGICAFAFVTHVVAATDILRQRSFPLYPTRMALVFVAGALGSLLYVPCFWLLSLIAWPGFEPDGSGSGYLVNCWAYRSALPSQGEWIWMRLPQLGAARAGQIVAVSGQEVEWTGQNWRVDGQEQRLHLRVRFNSLPQACRFKVPANQILVEPEDDGVSTPLLGPLVLVTSDRIIGRAWAQYYPVWDRHLL